ncbi:MAG: nucleotidyltransferase [Deltaproteobacteria bacterium]|nr:nucleotidyltransferase [Deltaproteobacteria bacterium]
MEPNKDFEEFFELLNKHKVRFVVVGGYAVIFHGYPRFTGDIDLFYEAEAGNVEALLDALKEFGFNFPELTVPELTKEGQVVQLGQPPNRIDLINQISGVKFTDVWQKKVAGTYGKESAFYIDLENLMRNKRAASRSKDQQDIDFFRKKED